MLSSFLNGMHNKTLHQEVLKSSAQTIDQALLVINQVVASEKSILLDHDLGPSRDKDKTLASEVQLSDPKKSRFLTVNNVIDENDENRARTQDANENELDENADDEWVQAITPTTQRRPHQGSGGRTTSAPARPKPKPKTQTFWAKSMEFKSKGTF
jgi:hypothetical protein